MQVEIIHTTFRRTLPPELACLEQNLFSYGASPFPGEADHITVTQWETRLEECRACAAVLRRHAMEACGSGIWPLPAEMKRAMAPCCPR